MSTVEIYASEKLQCSTADLVMLDKVYSALANSAFRENGTNIGEVIEDNSTLQDLLYVTYSQISYAITSMLKEKVEAVKNQEGLSSTVSEQVDTFNCIPSINFLFSRFDNDLDDVVDWDKGVEYNAELLMNQWVEDYFRNKED